MHRIPKQVLDHLAAVPLFSTCTKAELRTIATLGTEASLPDGRKLTEQGKPGREFCLMISGHARCFRDGREVATFGPGDYFGEMALLDGGVRNATIVSDGPVELLVLDKAEFANMLDASPSIARKLLVAFAARQRVPEDVRH